MNSGFYHAGVYCGEKEIIDFTGGCHKSASSDWVHVLHILFMFLRSTQKWHWTWSHVLWRSKQFSTFYFFYLSLLVPQCKKNCLISSITSTKFYGDVCKRHIKHFLNDRPYKIFRLRGGIPQNFTHKVQQAMSYEKAYHPITFNCWHFALKLLRDGGKRCHFQTHEQRSHTK